MSFTPQVGYGGKDCCAKDNKPPMMEEKRVEWGKEERIEEKTSYGECTGTIRPAAS